MRSPPPEEGRPGELQLVEASGIEALPGRVGRYAAAKAQALEVAKFIATIGDGKLSARVHDCGGYMLFRHYFTADQVRLHAANFCKKHLLCALCAVRRGSKALSAYMPRYQAVRLARPDLRPFLVTFTVANGPDLAERFKHLQRALQELWLRKHRKRGCSADSIEAAVWSYEFKRGAGSGLWHPHLHMVAMSSQLPDQAALRAEWESITGDSYMVDVRRIDEASPERGFAEVFKYALKFSDMEPADTFRAFEVLSGRRLVASSGLFRGVEIPEDLTDAPLLDELPFVELFFNYLDGRYVLAGRLPQGGFQALQRASQAFSATG